MSAPSTAQQAGAKESKPIAGEAFLRALSDHGVDYLLANPGTDFPPIVEAFSRAKKTNAKVPKPVLVPPTSIQCARTIKNISSSPL